MTLRRLASDWAGLASLALALSAMPLLLASCTSNHQTSGPAVPVSENEVIGTLVSKKDDRPVDGGIDLTLETAPGAQVLVRVPSIFMAPPRDAVQAMHNVVDAAKPGDRIRARGTRDEEGTLRAETLELVQH